MSRAVVAVTLFPLIGCRAARPRAASRPGASGNCAKEDAEAQKTFRRLKAYRQLPILRSALQDHMQKAQADSAIETIMKAA